MGDRLFVALTPLAEVLSALEVLIDPRRDADIAVHWAAPSNWHVTLAFMADAPAERQERLIEALAGAARRSPPLSLIAAGAGCFPHPGRAKVLWLGISDREGFLPPLARRVRTACERSGIPADGGPFIGHLTLARSRTGVTATRWLRLLDSFPPLSWQADRLQLVQSHLRRGGSVYRPVAEFDLAGEASA